VPREPLALSSPLRQLSPSLTPSPQSPPAPFHAEAVEPRQP
jgi:hypothetical protein